MISELETHEDMRSPWRGECDSDQHPWWSSSYDARLDREKPGFDTLEAQNFFRITNHHLFDPPIH